MGIPREKTPRGLREKRVELVVFFWGVIEFCIEI